MKLASCPWCEGKGTELTTDGPISNEAGAIQKFKYRDCYRCEGSGVISYRAEKEARHHLEDKAFEVDILEGRLNEARRVIMFTFEKLKCIGILCSCPDGRANQPAEEHEDFCGFQTIHKIVSDAEQFLSYY